MFFSSRAETFSVRVVFSFSNAIFSSSSVLTSFANSSFSFSSSVFLKYNSLFLSTNSSFSVLSFSSSSLSSFISSSFNEVCSASSTTLEDNLSFSTLRVRFSTSAACANFIISISLCIRSSSVVNSIARLLFSLILILYLLIIEAFF